MKNKTISVKDILNGEHLKSKKTKKDIDFKAIDMSNEKDVYIWADYWRKQRRKR